MNHTWGKNIWGNDVCTECGLSMLVATRPAYLGIPCPGPAKVPAPAPAGPKLPLWAQTAHQSTHFDIVQDGHVWLQDPVSGDHVCEGCKAYVFNGTLAPRTRCPTPYHHVVINPAGDDYCSQCATTFPGHSVISLAGCPGPGGAVAAINQALYGPFTAPPQTPAGKIATAQGLLPFATSEFFFINDPLPPTSYDKRCINCEKELSETLDKYWGRDPVEALKCSDCRYHASRGGK